MSETEQGEVVPNPPVAEDAPVEDDPVVTARAKQHLACSLFGLDPRLEKRSPDELFEVFQKLGKPDQEAYLNNIATARLGAAGIGTPQAPSVGTGITPGLARFDRFPKFSGEPEQHTDELPVEMWCDQLRSYLPPPQLNNLSVSR
jgi:hypothetical protein